MKAIEVVAGIICDKSQDSLIPNPPTTKYLATQRGYGDYKDFWEFPGGKMEPGETQQQALTRELKEELDIDVTVGNFICTVEYDYPSFHLTMHCYFCTITGNKSPKLLEHKDARWLTRADLRSVKWAPADIEVVKALESDIF